MSQLSNQPSRTSSPDGGPTLHGAASRVAGSVPRQPLLAALDIGTSSIKCLALRPDAGFALEVVGRAATAVQRPAPGWAEIDPQAILEAALDLLRQLGQFAEANNCQLQRVGLTGHISSIICVNGAGKPMGPCPIWQDQRSAQEAQAFTQTFGPRVDSLLGIRLPHGSNWPAPKLRWLREHQRQMIDEAWQIFQIKDYLFYHLTGQPYSDPVTQLGLSHLRQGTYAREILDWCGVQEQQMPQLRPPTTAVAMKADLGHELFGHEPPQIVVGTADMASGFLGCALELGQGLLMASSAELVGIASRADATATAPAGVVRFSVTPAMDLTYGVTSNGGASLQWLEQILKIDTAELFRAAAEAPPGSEGLLFLPYLSGERAPLWNPALSGMFAGLKSSHGRAHMCRAILEGCAYSKRHILDVIGGGSMPRPAIMRLGGGSARDELYNRIRASVLNLPLTLLPQLELSSLGALAIAGGEQMPDLVKCCQDGVARQRVEPVDAWCVVYEKGYQHYRQLVSWWEVSYVRA